MTPEQRQALTESLAHWEENVCLTEKGEEPETGPEVCACCRLWVNKNCVNCPIQIVTGQMLCRGTPYERVIKLIDLDMDCYEACVLERDWLKLILDSEVDDDG